MSIRDTVAISKETYTKWSEHEAPRLGASVAFYSLLSFAPLLVLTAAVIALIFGQSSAEGALVNEARQLIGDRGADTVRTLLKSAQRPSSGIFASLIAFATLLYGASGVFTELRAALNLMWDAPAKSSAGFWGMVKDRLLSFGMVLSIGFLLLVSLVLSAGLAFIGKQFGQLVPLPAPVLESLNFIVSFLVITLLFALMYKYVPNVKVPWREAIIGATGTALLFTIGKFLLGLYLGKASVGSTYGAAGSLVAVIVWIYYSAQIFFFGAEFTRVYAERKGALETERARQSAPSPALAQKAAAAFAASGTGGAQKAAEPLAVASPGQAAPGPVPAPIPTRVIPQPISPRRKTPVTKPKLLGALVTGFVLGKLVSSATSKDSTLR